VALFGAAVLWRARPPAAALLVGWLALVILLVTVQNRFYAYQWLPMLPAMTVLAIVGLHNVRTIRPLLAFLLGAAMLIECLAPIALEEARFASWVTGRMDRDAYYDAYGEPGDDMKTVRWLREQGKPGSVFVFGWNSSIAWLSGRPTVSRFGYSMPLVLGPEHEFRSPYRAELLSHLREQPPLYVIVGTQSEHIIGASVTLADFPELARLLDTEYREVQRIGKIVVLERR